MRVRASIAAAAMLFGGAQHAALGTQWQPRDVVPSTASLADALAALAQADGGASGAAQRREHWTYVNGARRIAVDVAVRGADFRTSLELDGLTYLAGRTSGARWRADGNGIAHGVQADLQGDALDSAPQALFPIDAAKCSLAGEARLATPTWVIETHPDGDKPAFLYIDKSAGTIVREVVHDGRRIITTNFDTFEPFAGGMRARHWRVDNGIRANALDVSVDTLQPAAVSAADDALPPRRPDAPALPSSGDTSADLHASFRAGRITLPVDVAGAREQFLLDTGTTSITVERALARRYGGTTLDHAVLPRLSIGPVGLDRVSVISVDADWAANILGLDFFRGRVVDIDYRKERVRILSSEDASAAFADAHTTTIAANIDQGIPLVTAAFGVAASDTFALDTGSPRLYVMRPFAQTYAAEIRAHWRPDGVPFVEHYLEGGIELQGYIAPNFAFGGERGGDIEVGVQIPTKRTDDLEIPFAGIIGTDILQSFDLIVDYDNGRIGVRP